MSVLRCACVFTLCLCCCLFDATSFFFFFVQTLVRRTSVQILKPFLLSWFKFLSEWSRFFPRFWTEWLEHIFLLSYAFFFFFTVNLMFKGLLIPFGCTKWRHVTRVYTDGAILHRIGACLKCRCCHFLTTTCVSFFFFSPLKLLTEAADMFSWVLVPLKTAFPAKNSSNACHACPFREFKLHWHYCGNPFALVVDLAWQILPWKLQAHFPE